MLGLEQVQFHLQGATNECREQASAPQSGRICFLLRGEVDGALPFHDPSCQ